MIKKKISDAVMLVGIKAVNAIDDIDDEGFGWES